MIEHEKAVIGSILEDMRQCEEVVSILKPEHFTDKVQRGLFEIILKMRKDNDHLDFTIIVTEAKRLALLNDSFGNYDEQIAIDIIESKNKCIPHHWKGYLKGINKTYKENQLKIMSSALSEAIEKGEDVTKVIERTKNDLEDLSGAMQLQKKRDLGSVLDEYCNNYDEIDNRRIATGFKLLDMKLDGGFKRKELVVLGARPGMGKSALAINMCVNMSKAGLSTAFVSLEMSDIDVAGRIASSELDINIHDLDDIENMYKFGTLQDDIKKRKQVFINDDTSLTIKDIDPYAASIKKDPGLDVLFIDHLHLVSTKEGSNRYEKMTHISREVKK